MFTQKMEQWIILEIQLIERKLEHGKPAPLS
uniref:Uncharacterized protein n=1 Tax=Medicago truncatula TaxID=3880 RepID=I3SEV3_MEDTR|nr:unknown [Medicago truncatula]